MTKPTSLRALLLAITLTGTTLAFTGNTTAKPTSGIPWRKDGPALLKSEQDRPILLRFFAHWCGPCRVMDANVWPDASVARMVNDRFIPVELDVDQPEVQEIARKFRIVAVPTVVLLDKSGKELNRANFMNEEQTLKFLENATMK